MPMNLNICFTDEEIEHDSTGLQDPLQCVGVQSCHWAIGPHGISQCIIDLSQICVEPCWSQLDNQSRTNGPINTHLTIDQV